MLASDNPTVVVDGVTKIYHAGSRSLFKSRAQRRRDDSDVVALRNVTMFAERGQSIGVLGRNGSGKSTLLKMIAGGESPTSGRVLVSAQPTLLGVSAALQPTLSGRANIRLGLLAQGVHPTQIEKFEGKICDFAEIGNAINRPMNTYSSGMGARLKFAISTAIQREILLIDEALATGDAAFNQKAKERMQEFLATAGTIFLVSHAPGTINELCDRAIWLHGGELIADGDTEYVTWQYRRWAAKQSRKDFESANAILAESRNDYMKPNLITADKMNELINKSSK